MRISLLYNEKAGGGVSKAQLREAIERHGHEILHAVEKGGEIEQALDGSPDVLVAAGGDGTVSRAARAVAGRAIALAVLPLGTANNVAWSLGIDGPIESLVAGWTRAARVTMDLGIVRGSWGERRFIEGAGVGLVSSVIAEMEHDPDEPPDAASRLTRAARKYLDVLSRLKARRRAVTSDGDRVEGAFLLVETLNIGAVGPNLALAPGADFADGLLSVVIAEEAHRDALASYLDARSRGAQDPLDLPVRLAREVELEDVGEMHLDDMVRSWPATETVSVHTEAAAVQVLVDQERRGP